MMAVPYMFRTDTERTASLMVVADVIFTVIPQVLLGYYESLQLWFLAPLGLLYIMYKILF